MAKIMINRSGTIIGTDKQWDVLAQTNEAGHLLGERIKSKNFFNFVRGDVNRMFLEAVLTRVNVTGKPYILHYRCDSPNTAQLIKMLVSKAGNDVFEIEHETLKQSTISPSIYFRQDQDASAQQCMVCGKVKFRNGWYDALTNRRIFGAKEEIRTRSTLCPSCEKIYYQPLTEQ